MLEAFIAGLREVMVPLVLGSLFVGVLMGYFVGLLPGLGVITTVAILLPFVWKAPPDIGLCLLMGMLPISAMTGAVTAILVNIPGEDMSAVVTLDGFPMNQRGEGTRAISIAVTASALGAFAAVAMAFVMIPMVVPIIMAFKFPELFFMILLGLTFVAALSRGSMLKGLISAGLGLLLSLIGVDSMTQVSRFTFGSMFLYDGLNIAVVFMGLFGLSEMIELYLSGQTTISKAEETKVKFKDMMTGVRDVFQHWWLWLRSTVIGYIVGVIPATGGMVAVWLAYGQAKQSSKDPDKFGKGSIEGIVAPQAASGSVGPGALLTTMAFGIPGSVVMAVFMGAFFMVGVTPGPILVQEHLDLLFLLLLANAIAAVMGWLLCMATTRYMAKISLVHMDFMFPLIMAILVVATFVTQDSPLAFIVLLVIGFLGYFMKSFGYNRGALCLGFVLGKLFEHYLVACLKVQGPLFFLTPISLVLIALIVALYSYPHLKPVLGRWLARK